ncbi:MAG: hypothetical protein ACREPE_02995 [Lysobacter sp.]
MRLAVIAMLVALGGCATVAQQPVPFALGAIASSEKPIRIGVAMVALPKVDTQLPGASCLLCLAAASIANSSLTSHSRTLPYEDLTNLKSDAADLLRKKGMDVVLIPEDLKLDTFPKNKTKAPNASNREFSSLKAKYDIDKLMVIDITSVGFVRTYSAYIPTSDPKGALEGTGYVVDLGTNTYDWYQPVSVRKSADGEWHEPPSFPGLTNAYFQAVTTGRDEFLKPLGLQ